jgi:hypothetical protein
MKKGLLLKKLYFFSIHDAGGGVPYISGNSSLSSLSAKMR